MGDSNQSITGLPTLQNCHHNTTRQILTASWGEPDSTTSVASTVVCDYVYEIIRTAPYAQALLKPRTSWADGECISIDT